MGLEGGGERGGSPGPLTPPLDGRGGGGLVVLALGGQPPNGGAHSSPVSLYPLGAEPSCRPSLGPPAPLAVAARCRWLGGGGGGGPVSAGGGSLGQRSAVSGLRGSVPPLALVAPSSLPQEVTRAPPSRCTVGGAWVGGPDSARGGRPKALSPSHPLAPIAWADGARPSPASSLVWGLGLQQWQVPQAVAPVGEGVAQSPGKPVVGIRIRDAEHRPPLQEGPPSPLSVGPRRLNHRPEDPLVVL